MAWDDYADRSTAKKWIIIGFGIVVAILVISFLYALARGTNSPERTSNVILGALVTTSTTRPGTLNTASTSTTLLPIDPADGEDFDNEEWQIVDEVDPAPHNEPLVPEDFEGKAIPKDQLPIVFPRTSSTLSTEMYAKATDAASALVRAQMTGEGRDRFPGYWVEPNDPRLPYAVGFTVDYSYATYSRQNNDLIRGVVVWHGQSPDGIVFEQVRIAVYFRVNPDQSLKALTTAQVPEEIRRTDALINGVSIRG